MKVFIKGLNTCVLRKQKIGQYQQFLAKNGHELATRAEDSDAARARYQHPFYTLNQRFGVTGYNLVNLGGV